MNTDSKIPAKKTKHKKNFLSSIRLTNARTHRSKKNSSNVSPKKEHKKQIRYAVKLSHFTASFTPRECEAILYRAKKDTYAEVAEAMGIRYYTVEFYFKNIREKLQCDSTLTALDILRKTDFFKRYQLIEGKIVEKK